MLAIGLAHHSTVVAQQRALDDAVMRADAYIGDRAPAQFRVNVTHTTRTRSSPEPCTAPASPIALAPASTA